MTAGRERRLQPRIEYRAGVLPPTVKVRPGRDVVVVNLSPDGLLVEGVWRFRPGSSVELHITFDATPVGARGRVLRCYVSGLDRVTGIRYRAAIALSTPIAVTMPVGLEEALGNLVARGDMPGSKWT
jgi:hypothetical protein